MGFATSIPTPSSPAGLLLTLLCAGSFIQVVHVQYTPDWKSLDSRPLPGWYDQGKIGIFIHLGVFSVPSFGNEWFVQFWKVNKIPSYVEFMKKNYPPDFNYGDFAADLKMEFFDPYSWAKIFNASGAKYIVFVSKHAEGYTNWPSKTSFNWNSMDVGAKRDIVGELEEAVRSTTSLKFGMYHCLYEWINPLYLQDKANNFTTQEFPKTKTLPALYEMVKRYRPDIVWSDGDWEAPDDYWMSKEFLAWLYNESPVKDHVLTNDRWGKGVKCTHGGFWDCGDRFNPGYLIPHKWEQCMTLDKTSWGFRRNAPLADYLSIEELLLVLARTISCGGNLLVNVGPTKYGQIDPLMEERLRQMGQWLHVNGEAIYGSKVWTFQNDTLNPDVWYTSKSASNGINTTVYAIFLSWPRSSVLSLGGPRPSSQTKVTLVGYQGAAAFTFKNRSQGGIDVTLPNIPVSLMPGKWAWVLRLEGLANQKPVLPSKKELMKKMDKLR
ncbi:alpha-L-fucosidase-like isoform X3 [Littorina saxatilis]|uniref:alpha-L-fucosidase-like isoform X3 n=1 Tax=Littorina saxatilis TaxID=31220 RepID=UPI0038B5C229